MNTGELLKTHYDRLPKDVQEAIQSVDIREKISKLAQKHSLRTDSAGVLEEETLFILLGMEPIGDYGKNIVRHVGVSQGVANAIVLDANEAIFGPVRNSLITLQEKERQEAIQQEGSFFQAPEGAADSADIDADNDGGADVADGERIDADTGADVADLKADSADVDEDVPDRDTLLEEIENEDMVADATADTADLNPKTSLRSDGADADLSDTDVGLPAVVPSSLPTTTTTHQTQKSVPAPEALAKVSAPVDTPAPAPTTPTTPQKPTADPFASVKEKLEKTVVPKKEVVKIDPYREPTA